MASIPAGGGIRRSPRRSRLHRAIRPQVGGERVVREVATTPQLACTHVDGPDAGDEIATPIAVPLVAVGADTSARASMISLMTYSAMMRTSSWMSVIP